LSHKEAQETQKKAQLGFARKVLSAKKIFSRKDAKAQRNP
jgi:hypothetical protein